jgi:LuxR family maltose regulon positive regulatory protein
MDILMGAYEVLVRVRIAQGNLADAEHTICEMERVNKSADIPLFRPWIESLQVHLWLAQGDLIAASDWAEHTPYSHEALLYSRENASLALVHVDMAQQRYPQALQRLTALLSSAEEVARVGSMISILALQVAALQASGATHEARHVLQRLLTLAEPEGYVRVFLDAEEPMRQALRALLSTERMQLSPISSALASYARTVLIAFEYEQRREETPEKIPAVSRALPPAPSPSSQTAQQLFEPLTPRELEVLHLLAEGASNQEIARRLVVSLATAKKHVASILGKLEAENRTRAIAHARTRSLL